jgi:hypothetical protein
MRISASHLNVLVSHQYLHCPQIDASHDQSTCERLPQIVPGEILNTGLLHGSCKPVLAAFKGCTALMISPLAHANKNPACLSRLPKPVEDGDAWCD